MTVSYIEIKKWIHETQGKCFVVPLNRFKKNKEVELVMTYHAEILTMMGTNYEYYFVIYI